MTHTIASCGSGSSIVSSTELLSAGAGVGTGTGAGTTAGEPEAVLSGAVASCAGSLGAAAAGASDAGVDSDGASSCMGADAASSGWLSATSSAGSDDAARLSGSLSASKAGAEDDTTEDAAELDTARLDSVEEALQEARRIAQTATRAKALAGFLSLNLSVFQNQADRKNGQENIAITHHKQPCPVFLPPFWGGCGSVSSGDGTGIRDADGLAAFNFAVLPSAIRGFFL